MKHLVPILITASVILGVAFLMQQLANSSNTTLSGFANTFGWVGSNS